MKAGSGERESLDRSTPFSGPRKGPNGFLSVLFLVIYSLITRDTFSWRFGGGLCFHLFSKRRGKSCTTTSHINSSIPARILSSQLQVVPRSKWPPLPSHHTATGIISSPNRQQNRKLITSVVTESIEEACSSEPTTPTEVSPSNQQRYHAQTPPLHVLKKPFVVKPDPNQDPRSFASNYSQTEQASAVSFGETA